jgi:hypothetical protein
MLNWGRVIGCSACAAVVAWSLTAATAAPQPASGTPNPSGLPAAAPVQQFTPDEMRTIIWWRALQKRGRGQVRTGVPQFVPFGNPWSFGMPMQPSTQAEPRAKDKTSAQRRAEARAAREEEKRVAREKAKAKREAAAKARAQAQAKGKAKDEPQPPAEP